MITGDKKHLIVAHGDLDGIISAVLVARKYCSVPVNVIFTQPSRIDRVKISGSDDITVVDIAVNNNNPSTTYNFIARMGACLKSWYDHHTGWDDYLNDPRFIVDDNAASCAEIIGGDFALIKDATAADTRLSTLSPRAEIIEHAIKADLSNDSIRQAAFYWLLGNEDEIYKIEKAAAKYQEILQQTLELAKTYIIHGNVALVDIRNNGGRYDLSRLLIEGQNLAPNAIAIVGNSNSENTGLVVATSSKSADLVKTFKLASGSRKRLSLPYFRLGEALVRLSSDIEESLLCCCA